MRNSAFRIPHSAFAIAVFCLAIFQFSENTADPDLWSHVFFGKQFIQTGKPTTTDYYSWTAYGQPSFDHEYLGEAVFGLAYLALGGPGLLLLKIVVGLLTFGIALSISRRVGQASCLPVRAASSREFDWAQDAPSTGRQDACPTVVGGNSRPNTMLVARAFGALAVVEISFGFAARPQIFTALSLAVELWILNRIHAGTWRWAFALPPLFALWFNLHGGALVGLFLLFITAAATSAQIVLIRLAPKTALWLEPNIPQRVVPALWISAIISAATVVLNPHGFELARWLVGSVLWLRPQIQEWNPATLTWDHAAFFFCAAFAAAAFILSRRRRQLWEVAVLVVLFLVAVRAVRNTPLFCIAALAIVPPHLAGALQRFRGSFQRFEELFRRPGMQNVFAAILLCVSAAIIVAACTLHKKHFWTMEVPRSQYPVAAIQFIRQYDVRGNLLVYFDWGEMCIWRLPNSPVSIDGRLDSVYSPAIIDAHWKLYNGEPFDTNVLNLARADFALLPSHLAGGEILAKIDGWHPVYFDDCAVVLVKNPAQFPKLAGLRTPVQGPPSATDGRDPFP
ncbi:MAG TPA: hypothetical protein VMF08_17845 [Candidatus Sulfotelmatobacter sp.]|nr:hypothetical protein [Candidatus Sulfotelmatobacter sp.]